MRRKIDTLKDALPVIKQLGAEVGMEITEEAIARRMNMSRETLDTYLNATTRTPNDILTQLWVVFDDVIKAVQRSNRSAPLRCAIDLVKRLAMARGIDITDNEIVGKIGLPREQFEAYLSGEVTAPDEVLSLFSSTWPDLFRNVEHVSFTVEESLEEEDE